MTLMYFIISFLIYCAICALPYTSFKHSKCYYLLAVSGIITQGLWLTIAKLSKSNNDLLIRGIYFDAMITTVYIVIPIMFFNVSLTKMNICGIALIILGLFVSKL